jgi:hypothetical protein
VAEDFPEGTVHTATPDVRVALTADPALLPLWSSLTPLGRNEFLCWIEDAKQAKTREKRIARMAEELREGQRRPCCWAGCIHRTDKAPGKWQQAVLIDKMPRRGS